ncbi:hypothetical protein V6N13_129490 [Hibiscus sabdariffa]|uniref:Uncharacterized protein n=1 Tax=Hibiscus sabdariffa TaxID=183260 RepID=A0ABR2SM47_9ROSI
MDSTSRSYTSGYVRSTSTNFTSAVRTTRFDSRMYSPNVRLDRGRGIQPDSIRRNDFQTDSIRAAGSVQAISISLDDEYKASRMAIFDTAYLNQPNFNHVNETQEDSTGDDQQANFLNIEYPASRAIPTYYFRRKFDDEDLAQ